MAVIALCDCDNFFVSCERIMRPDLAHTPAVVLSANDGCVIARSAEVKAMGIKMGEPYFAVKALFERRGVVVFSGNMPYYSSVSRRVMAVLARWSDTVEQYSIDEAFLNFAIRSIDDKADYAARLREDVRRYVGVPISIGIASSKTLAKLASKEAKRSGGVHLMTEASRRELLEQTDIGDVWGIGPRRAEFLRKWGVRTAADLARRDEVWVRDRLHAPVSVTQMELRGTSCIPLDPTPRAPKSVQSSHAFGTALSDISELVPPMIEHAAKAARVMRGHRLAARSVSIFLLDGYISREHRFVSADARFERPASDDRTITNAALALLREIYREGRKYTRAGITLGDLTDAASRQTYLFDQDRAADRAARAAAAVDAINAHLGRRAVFPAALAVRDKKWKCKGEMRSPGELTIS